MCNPALRPKPTSFMALQTSRWGLQVSCNPSSVLVLYLSAKHLNSSENCMTVQLPCKQAKSQKAKGKRQKGSRQRAKVKCQPAEGGVVKTRASSTGLPMYNNTYAFRVQKTANTALKKKTADNREEEGCQEGTKAYSKQKEATSRTIGEVELQQKQRKQTTATEGRRSMESGWPQRQ